MGFLPPKTASGACTYDSLSALKKYVRRSMTHEALVTAFDLAPRHMAVLPNRLRIISHEDIGIACPAASFAAWDWGDELWGHLRGGAPEWKPLLAPIVQVLCGAGKSRLADHAGRIGQDRAEFGPHPALAVWDTTEAARILLREGTEEDFITALFGIRRSRPRLRRNR